MQVANQTNYFNDADIVSQYTRQDAIEDGVLIDVTDFAEQMLGVFKIPVAITATIWGTFISTQSNMDTMFFDELIRLRNLLIHVATEMRAQILKDEKENRIEVEIEDINEQMSQVFIECGPGDHAEPVLTIMTLRDL